MIILGIETSCDETSIALLEATKKKGNFLIHPIKGIVSSQIKIHAPYGGVVPMLASREHAKNLEIVFQEIILPVFGSINKFQQSLDLIAVTQGPGLIPALLMGVNFSKTLAWAWQKPIIGVNHLRGHLLSFLLPPDSKNVQIPLTDFQKIFPAIGLLVSGGHTLLVYIRGIGQYEIIGETRDDAAGECFDKGARILGLGYPGGPVIAQMASKILSLGAGKSAYRQASQNSKTKIKMFTLPRPMINSLDYDFSFSGLKTALLYSWQEINNQEKKKLLPRVAYELQEAITDVLVAKTLKAAQNYSGQSIILGGGVTANQRLRDKFQEQLKHQSKSFNFYLPLLEYTTDNAMMIALAGFFDYLSIKGKERKKLTWDHLMAEANLRV